MKILMVVYDNDSHLSWFPQGLAYLASACLEENHNVDIYQQDIYHWPDEHLRCKLEAEDYDVVLLSVIGGYYQYRKLLSLSKQINLADNRKSFTFIIGGHGPAADPAYFLKKTGADFCGIGEGEITIVELLEAIENNMPSYQNIHGIAYLRNGECIITDKRSLISNIDKIPYPAWDLFNMDYYSLLRMPNIKKNERSFPVLSGRGCTFECNFCYRMDKGFRPRSAKSIIDEISVLKERYAISYIIFSDELLMSSKKRTIELSQALIDAELNIKWECNGRLNYASKEVLSKMKEAGCVFINYGIESLDNSTLKVMNKALTREIIIKGIENTLDIGISPGLNIIYGNINEPIEAIDAAVEFLLKYDDHSQLRTIRPVTPYPGSPLFDYAIEKGFVKDTEDFYENLHENSDLLTVNFTKYPDDDIYKKLNWANKKLINEYINAEKTKMLEVCDTLYLEKNKNFRGFRQT